MEKQNLIQEDLLKNKEKIEQYRSKYLPSKIKLLLVAYAPPDDCDRFFYFPFVKTADYLFLAIIKVFFGDSVYYQYIDARKKNGNKNEYLEKLKEKGVFLMDLSSFPEGKVKPESQKDTFIKSLKKLTENGNIDKNTPIILIKRNVYDCLYLKLTNEGYCVINQSSIPFPSCGQQKKFNEDFTAALQRNNINITC